MHSLWNGLKNNWWFILLVCTVVGGYFITIRTSFTMNLPHRSFSQEEIEEAGVGMRINEDESHISVLLPNEQYLSLIPKGTYKMDELLRLLDEERKRDENKKVLSKSPTEAFLWMGVP